MSHRTPLYLILLSTLLSGVIFFSFGHVINAFPNDAPPTEWYSFFSRTLFDAHTEYSAESVLLPLVAKLLGANETPRVYEGFCVALNLCLLPLITLYAYTLWQSPWRSVAFMVVFAVTFKYLWAYTLGFPDPLTIALLSLAGLSALMQKPFVTAIFIFFAGLSHFSSTVLASGCLMVAVFCSTTEAPLSQRLRFIAYCLGALIACKLFLQLWYFYFDYKLETRVDWVLGKDLSFFKARYFLSRRTFWLTPGISLLLLYCMLIAYWLLKKRLLLALAALFSLVIGYMALFFTIDGARVFYIVIPAAYVYFLSTVISTAFKAKGNGAPPIVT